MSRGWQFYPETGLWRHHPTGGVIERLPDGRWKAYRPDMHAGLVYADYELAAAHAEGGAR